MFRFYLGENLFDLDLIILLLDFFLVLDLIDYRFFPIKKWNSVY